MKRIILFDGECNFCDKSVQFILKRDPNEHFHFASLQSKIGKELLSQFNVPNNINSLVLIENNQCFFKSSAALRVCKKLKGAVFCNRKVQRNAIKNAEVCHPFNSFSTMRGTVYSSRHEKR